MAETWTAIATQDDPGAAHRAVEVGRVYRDNDDCLTRGDQIARVQATGITGLNQTYPNRVATGAKVRFFKPAFAKKVSFRYWLGKTSAGAVRMWSVVRFNNNGALETPLADTNVSAYPAVVTDFDVSSLAEGFYDAEVYAGHAGAAGDPVAVNLPSGRQLADPTPPSMPGDFSALDYLRWGTVDWSSSPGCDLLDATHLSKGKGHSSTVLQMWYDRDEKLRRRPAGYSFAERSSTSVHPAFTGFTLGKLYVPRWADVLALEFEAKKTGGGAGVCRVIFDCVEMASAGFPFFSAQVSQDNGYSPGAGYGFATSRLSLAPMRGKEATIRAWMNVTTSGDAIFARMLPQFQGARWEAGALSGQSLPVAPWREWEAAGRSQGTLLSAGWWRRMTSRDLDLQERQMFGRPFSLTLGGTQASFGAVADSYVTVYQPKGVGASAGKLVAYVGLSGSAGFVSDMKLDYSDEPDGATPAGTVLNALDGTYRLTRNARADRDGSERTFALFVRIGHAGSIYSLTDANAALFSWRR